MIPLQAVWWYGSTINISVTKIHSRSYTLFIDPHSPASCPNTNVVEVKRHIIKACVFGIALLRSDIGDSIEIVAILAQDGPHLSPDLDAHQMLVIVVYAATSTHLPKCRSFKKPRGLRCCCIPLLQTNRVPQSEQGRSSGVGPGFCSYAESSYQNAIVEITLPTANLGVFAYL